MYLLGVVVIVLCNIWPALLVGVFSFNASAMTTDVGIFGVWSVASLILAAMGDGKKALMLAISTVPVMFVATVIIMIAGGK